MGNILQVRFAEGDIVEQLFMLKVSALANHDEPAMWRLTESLMELLLGAAHGTHRGRWPNGYISESRLFGVPVDFVHDLPHLLCEDYIVYPYSVPAPGILLAH